MGQGFIPAPNGRITLKYLLVDNYNGNEPDIFDSFEALTTHLRGGFDADQLKEEIGRSIQIFSGNNLREIEIKVETVCSITEVNPPPITLDSILSEDFWIPYNCQEGR